MPRVPGLLPFLVPVVLLFGLPSSPAQTQGNQPPANYNGPDTYGLCAFLIGDTEYFSRTFYTSSYFKFKAEADIRAYAQSQAKGASVKSHCLWSFREATLTTARETDQRLIGLPGHPAKAVEANWTFQGSPLNPPGAAAAGNAASANGTAANTRTGAATRSAGTVRSTSSAGTATAASGNTGATANAGTGNTASTGSSTAGSLTGASQQSLSDAKNNAVSTAAGGISTATTSAVGALSSGMQNMFRRKQAQPVNGSAATSPGGPAPAGQSAAQASAGTPPAEGFGFAAEPSSGPAAHATAPEASASAHAVESIIADVSGKDLILNQGAQAGLREGMILTVLHPQRTVNDPTTGKPLRTIEATIGELKILSVDANSASAIFSGPGVPVVGDKARLKP